MIKVTTELDTSGLYCPQHILRTTSALNNMRSGEVLRVIANTPGSIKDINAFCNLTDNELLPTSDLDGEYTFLIRKN